MRVLVILLCISSMKVFAQQMPQYTQYLINGYVINPAIAGSTNYFEGKINHRQQWIGINDAPRTNIISVNGPLKTEKMGIGGYIYSDINGPTRQLGVNMSYSYHIKLTDEVKLSMAIYGAFLQFAIDGSKITTKNINDPILTNGMQTSLIPDAGFSTYAYSKKYFLGISLAQLTHTKISYREITANTTGRLAGHYFVMGGYNYDINEDFQLQPSFLIKYVSPVPVQAEFSARATYKNAISAALSYRTSDAMSLTFGYLFQNQISIGYSYDFLVSRLKNYSSGSHEVMVSVRFKDRQK